MLRYLFRKWTKLEFVASLASIVSLVVTIIQGFTSEPKGAILIVLTTICAASFLWLLLLATRKSFVIVGYRNTMEYLETLAKHTRHRIWTARTHTGSGITERGYFTILAERLTSQDYPLEDFRRLFRLTPQARDHVDTLLADFLYKDAAEVRYFTAGGPQFDFMVADDIAVIGFPMAGGTGNVAAIVLRKSDLVDAVANVFTQLWQDPETKSLFRGTARFPETARRALLIEVDRLFLEQEKAR